MKTAQEVANELDLTRTEVYNLLRKKRFSPLVKKNGGQVAISNELFKLLEEEIKNKKLLYMNLFNNSFQRNIYLVYNKERGMLPVVKEFIDYFKSSFELP